MPLWAVITTISISSGSIIIAVLFHAFTTVRWGARIEFSMIHLKDDVCKIGKELEKRDDQISAIWKRLDQIRDLIPPFKSNAD